MTRVILYFKVGTLPGRYYRVVRKRKAPVVGECFKVKDPDEKYAKPEPVRLLETRELRGVVLYVCERF